MNNCTERRNKVASVPPYVQLADVAVQVAAVSGVPAGHREPVVPKIMTSAYLFTLYSLQLQPLGANPDRGANTSARCIYSPATRGFPPSLSGDLKAISRNVKTRNASLTSSSTLTTGQVTGAWLTSVSLKPHFSTGAKAVSQEGSVERLRRFDGWTKINILNKCPPANGKYSLLLKNKIKSASDLSLLPLWFFLRFLVFIRLFCKHGLRLGPIGGDGSTRSKPSK